MKHEETWILKRKRQARISNAYKLWRRWSSNRLSSTQFCLRPTFKSFLAEVYVTFLRFIPWGTNLCLSGKSTEGQSLLIHVILFKDSFTFYIKPDRIHRTYPAAQALAIYRFKAAHCSLYFKLKFQVELLHFVYWGLTQAWMGKLIMNSFTYVQQIRWVGSVCPGLPDVQNTNQSRWKYKEKLCFISC